MTGTTPHAPLLAWVSMLDPTERQAFYAALATAVATAAANDDECVIEECLRHWRLSAESMLNARLRDQLLEH